MTSKDIKGYTKIHLGVFGVILLSSFLAYFHHQKINEKIYLPL